MQIEKRKKTKTIMLIKRKEKQQTENKIETHDKRVKIWPIVTKLGRDLMVHIVK